MSTNYWSRSLGGLALLALVMGVAGPGRKLAGQVLPAFSPAP